MKKLLFVGLVIILCSCNLNPNKINIEFKEKPKIENINISTNSIRSNIKLTLNSTHKLIISDIDLKISDNSDDCIGIVKINDKIKILRGHNNLLIPLKIYLSSGAFKLIPIITTPTALKKVYISGSFKVKSGIVCRRIKLEHISVADFINNYI